MTQLNHFLKKSIQQPDDFLFGFGKNANGKKKGGSGISSNFKYTGPVIIWVSVAIALVMWMPKCGVGKLQVLKVVPFKCTSLSGWTFDCPPEKKPPSCSVKTW